MKIDTNGNLYTFIYAAVLVIVVAAALAFTAIQLQPLQEQNVKVEKMQNILQSVGFNPTVENASELYAKYVQEDFVVDINGERKEGKGFDVNMKKESRKTFKIKALKNKLQTAEGSEKAKLQDELNSLRASLNLPVYVCEKDGDIHYIFPLQGKGLWGPIWGYIALDNDFNTIYGAVFDHKAETPGLGADINKDWFEQPFSGKTLFEGDEFVSITLYKGGKGSAVLAGDSEHGCDAISGGTITSKGLERMLKEEWLYNYEAFLKKNKK
ncbi:MAG: NADH:ubiquinone reductase (Na(+)-transporting) subunit C [Bacteroidales bacterium]|nr:NADH:ubiquinone reductase (Na(+)-transporting) subunit C [Bacteroidales bacterium]